MDHDSLSLVVIKHSLVHVVEQRSNIIMFIITIKTLEWLHSSGEFPILELVIQDPTQPR